MMKLIVVIVVLLLLNTTNAILPTMEIDIFWADEYHNGDGVSSTYNRGRNTDGTIDTNSFYSNNENNNLDDTTTSTLSQSATTKRSTRLSGSGTSSSSKKQQQQQVPFTTMYASQAWFGIYPLMKFSKESSKGYIPVLPPSDDIMLCNTNYKESDASMYPDTTNIMIVGRGTCSFEQKAHNAQTLGASAIIIYGTLGSRYSYNETTSTIIYPQNLADYDCTLGEADISTDTLSLYGGYDNTTNDSQLMGQNNLCTQANAEFVETCSSNACLLTGNTTSETKMKACCAWDIHIPLYNDPNLEQQWRDLDMSQVSIPALYVSLQQGHELLELMGTASSSSSSSNNNNKIVLELYERWRPTYNWSAIVVWGVGVFVAWLSSYLSSSDYRHYYKWSSSRKQNDDFDEEDTGVVTTSEDASSSDGKGSQYQRLDSPRQRKGGRSSASSSEHGSGTTEDETNNPESQRALMTELIPSPDGQKREQVGASTAGAVATTNIDQNVNSSSTGGGTSSYAYGEETVVLTWHHAFSFLIFSSCSLFVLFYFKIYSFLKVMYGIGCSGALSQVVVVPLLEYICEKTNKQHYTYQHNNPHILFHCLGEPVTPVDLVAVIISYTIGIIWIIIGFTVKPDPSIITFYWLVQDIFGACMCITFLGVIRLNNIKVATILLIAAFVYDIFFVFITPYIFHGKSIMITVATSGGPPTADPTFCEKYPLERACQGGQPLPMLFAIPRLFDYQGGSSLLGLGDIVLPGLLLSFACRLDNAKRLVGGGKSSSTSGNAGGISRCGYLPATFISKVCQGITCCCCCCCFHSNNGQNNKAYFGPCVIAYAIGLMMANIAVYVMQMGQPALLYLVPMCLGTFCLIAYQNNEFHHVWNTPHVLQLADEMINPQQSQSSQHYDEGQVEGTNEQENSGSGGTSTNNDTTDEMSAMAYAAASSSTDSRNRGGGTTTNTGSPLESRELS